MTVAPMEPRQLAKARGGFYTPAPLTRFLADWAVRSVTDRILEPSAGDGAFLAALLDRFAQLDGDANGAGIVAIERQPSEADKLRALVPSSDVRAVDFFDVAPASVPSVTAVVGNPPYIRYQHFNGATRAKARARSHAQGVELTNLASSWAHFVIHASAFLGDGGRLALVLPSELLHTDYAEPVRAFLIRRFRSVTVIAFDRAVFESAQVDAILLLASDDGPSGFRVVRVKDAEALAGLHLETTAAVGTAARRWSTSVDVEAGGAYADLLASGRFHRLGALADVDIGFVSGATDFFVLSREDADSHGLPDAVLTPVLRRPRDVPGLIPREDEIVLLLATSGHLDLDEATQRYLAFGERLGIPERYKCRNRVPWHAVRMPRRRPDAFMPYMHHLGPRLIVNTTGARNTNLLHGVALRADAPTVEALAVAMASSVTLLSAELEGRAYGGGVLKLETKEAENLLVPAAQDAGRVAQELPVVDDLIRRGEIKLAAELVDELLAVPHDRVWPAYLAMRTRRLERQRRVSSRLWRASTDS